MNDIKSFTQWGLNYIQCGLRIVKPWEAPWVLWNFGGHWEKSKQDSKV